MPLRGPQGQGGSRAGTSMRGGPMGRGDYGKYNFLYRINSNYDKIKTVLSLLVSQVTIPKYAKIKEWRERCTYFCPHATFFFCKSSIMCVHVFVDTL